VSGTTVQGSLGGVRAGVQVYIRHQETGEESFLDVADN
jgi:hypothetical protein